MRRAWVLAAGIALCGCSGHRQMVEACAAPAIVAGVAYYPACAVDRQAKQIASSGPRLTYTPSVNQNCVRAIIDVVADAKGTPIPATAKIVRTNDNGFATAVLGSLTSLRYEPARKDGQPVAQMVRVDVAMVLLRSTGGLPSSGAAARSASRTC